MNIYSSYSDDQLIFLLKESNQAAFEVLYERYAPQLLKTAIRQLNEKQSAEEIVHDIFLSLWQIRETSDIINPEAYLKQSLKNRIINYILRTKQPAFFELFETIISSPYLPDEAIRQKDIVKLIESWIEVLPEKRKQIFIRRYFDQCSTQEISTEMSLAEKTIQNHLSLSLNYLRKRFSHLLTTIITLNEIFF